MNVPNLKYYRILGKLASAGLIIGNLLVVILFFMNKSELLLPTFPNSKGQVISFSIQVLLTTPLLAFYLWTIKLNKDDGLELIKLIFFPGVFYAFYKFWFKDQHK